MIRCGMVLNLSTVWEQRQLSPDLLGIVKKYSENFDGAPVGTIEHMVVESYVSGSGVQ